MNSGVYAEVLSGLHHIAISATSEQFKRLVAKVRAASIEMYAVNGDSAYFPGPDGERIELLSYPLHEMYGSVVG